MQVEGYSIDTQKELLINFARSKEFNSYKFYIDGGFSGKDLNRPAIKTLIKDVKNKKVDCVIVYKLDRISRSQRDTLFLIEEIFNKYNVGFISIRENFDTTSPFGKAMIGILSVFAQLERETILERTRLGLRKRVESGLWRGGGKIPFPYDYDKEKGILVPNSEKVEILNKMIALYLEGKSFNKIATIVGMDESLVEKRILSITNTGKIFYKGEIFKGRHKPVVSESTYQEIIKINKMRSKTRTARRYLLSGKLYCSYCGAKYRYQKWGNRIICYCYSQQKSKPKFIKDPNCKNKRHDSFEIENKVLEQIFKIPLDKKYFDSNLSIIKINEAEELQNRLNKIKGQIKNLLTLVEQDIDIIEIKDKIKSLQTEREKIQKQINITKATNKKTKLNKSKILNLGTIWNLITFEEQRLIIEYLIEKIIIQNDNLKIYYKIK